MAKTAARARKKEKKNVVTGVAHVNATFNNTIVTITDQDGNVLTWGSSGAAGLGFASFASCSDGGAGTLISRARRPDCE